MVYSDEQKAQAVARVRTADATAKQVAADLGCSINTLRTWLKQTPRTESEKTIAERVAQISDQIEQKQAETRQALLDRVAELVPECGSLKDVATAYGIITDKALLAAGKPTSIQGQAIAVGEGTAEELEKTVEELRSRRMKA